jgi:hypothetical protein
VDAEGLRRKVADLLEQAKAEADPVNQMTLIELAVAFLAKARELDPEKTLN